MHDDTLRADRRRHWGRAGALAGVVWFVVAAGVTLWNAQPGYQRLDGLVTLLAGPLAFLTIGWIFGLRRPGDWSRAAVTTLVIFSSACVVALVLLVMALWRPR